ncbi:MAG TPA: hypothetical protein VFU74_23185 [Actinocrinis sp.]|nr:hypothetical protein [Actinocrinis sp.]
MKVLIDSARSNNAALVVVTHDPAVSSMVDRVFIMDSGILVDAHEDSSC